ncbi:MAG: SIMPL domain-containing protein [Planctomycetota bacterium]|nr:SIMPL domain-containing protein [Planctomycetota bacterium]
MRRRLGSLLIAAMALSLSAAAIADDDEDDMDGGLKLEDTPKLTVRGEAELEKPADQMRLSIGVVTENRDADEALQENNDRMNAVVKAMQRVGLGEDEYQTGRFRIRPQYSRRPRQPAPDWRPQIIGYEVNNSVTVKTQKLDLAGEIIGAANDAGANTVDITAFELSDKRRYRAEALQEATKHAAEDAATVAEAAGLKLVRILAVNVDYTPIRPVEMDVAAPGRMAARAGGAPPITPGDVSVTANVTIVYEIAPKE